MDQHIHSNPTWYIFIGIATLSRILKKTLGAFVLWTLKGLKHNQEQVLLYLNNQEQVCSLGRP